MKLRPPMLALTFSLTAMTAACGGDVTDEKGNSCPITEAYTTADDDIYCADENAVEDCESLIDDVIKAFADCGMVDEQELRDELEANDELLFDCSKAKATSTGFEDCQTAYQEYECGEDMLPNVDDEEVCKGVVLVVEDDEEE